MNKRICQTLSAICVAGLLYSARAQTNPPANPDTNNPPANPETPGTPDQGSGDTATPDTNAAPSDDTSGATTNEATATLVNHRPGTPEDRPAATLSAAQMSPDLFMPPSAPGTNLDELRLNFRNAPLEMVLNYLSDAAGFIIVLDTQARGTVSVISKQPMTRNEAVDLLNSVLNKNGLAAIRDGRTLTIVDKTEAKTRDIPVKVSNDPDQIPKNAEIVTQIIPVRFVDAEQLQKDLSSFVSSEATIIANEAGNSIVITDTQSNIRHLVEIIKAIDSSAEGETQIRVFHLAHANPTDVANELASIFPSNNGSSGSTQSPIRFGGPGGFPGGGPGGFFARMMGGGGGGAATSASGSSSARMQKQTQVLAVADLRTSSVIVTASKDLMEEIDGMMTQLDVSSSRDQKVFVFHMKNGDSMQDLQVLQSMFGGNNSSSSSRGGTSSSTSGSALQTRETQNATSSGTGSTTTSGSSSSGIGGSSGGGGNRF